MGKAEMTHTSALVEPNLRLDPGTRKSGSIIAPSMIDISYLTHRDMGECLNDIGNISDPCRSEYRKERGGDGIYTYFVFPACLLAGIHC